MLKSGAGRQGAEACLSTPFRLVSSTRVVSPDNGLSRHIQPYGCRQHLASRLACLSLYSRGRGQKRMAARPVSGRQCWRHPYGAGMCP